MNEETMNDSLGLVLKLLLLSALISILIKTGGPALALPATSVNALIAVMLPPLVLASILGWRAWRQTFTLK
jgi:hypothetical protein